MVTLRIKELLEERNLSTMDFCKKTGLAYNTALGLVRGTSDRIKLVTIGKVCAALDVTPGDLFEYAPPPVALPEKMKRTRAK